MIIDTEPQIKRRKRAKASGQIISGEVVKGDIVIEAQNVTPVITPAPTLAVVPTTAELYIALGDTTFVFGKPDDPAWEDVLDAYSVSCAQIHEMIDVEEKRLGIPAQRQRDVIRRGLAQARLGALMEATGEMRAISV